MGFNYGWRGPNIVKSGLVMYLDAGSPNSYYNNTSGTTWKDISGNSNNGTLTNGPVYDSTNGGNIVFDGTNDYVITQNTTLDFSTNSNFTYCVWIYPSFNSALNSGRAVLDFTSVGPAYNRAYLRWENASLGFYFDIANNTGGSAWRTTTAPSFSANTWQYLCFTHSSSNTGLFYFNGAQRATSNLASTARTVNNNPITVGYGAVNSYYWSGRMSNILIYNVVLSDAEILQNYNAQKSRFGL